MKNLLISLLLSIPVFAGHSQTAGFEYSGRFSPAVKQEKLNDVRFLGDITTDFMHHLVMAQQDRVELDKVLYEQGITVFPAGNYNKIVEFISVEISAKSSGITMSLASPADELTPEQRNLISQADLGSDLSIKIKFRLKPRGYEATGSTGKIMDGIINVTVIPAAEASYPGGFGLMSAYFRENVFNKISGKDALDFMQRSMVTFTINENGKVVNTRISRTSTDPAIDKLILEATNKMPLWKPAENSRGKKVRQEFNIPFGMGGGC